MTYTMNSSPIFSPTYIMFLALTPSLTHSTTHTLNSSLALNPTSFRNIAPRFYMTLAPTSYLTFTLAITHYLTLTPSFPNLSSVCCLESNEFHFDVLFDSFSEIFSNFLSNLFSYFSSGLISILKHGRRPNSTSDYIACSNS